MLDKTEIYYPDYLEQGQEGYSFDRVLNEVCNGNIKLAKAIWSLCDWQFPETLLDEYIREGEVVEYAGKYYHVYDYEEYEQFMSLNQETDENYIMSIINANSFREQEGLYVMQNEYEFSWVKIFKAIQTIKEIDENFIKASGFKTAYNSIKKIDQSFQLQKVFSFDCKWSINPNGNCYNHYIEKLFNAYNSHSFGEFEGKPIMLKDLKPCLLLSNDGQGYKESLLAANKISKNNGFHLVVNKNGKPMMGGAMIVQDTEQVRKVLDSVPESEQYDLMIQFRHPEYAKLYWSE